MLGELGYTRVRYFRGGLEAWQAGGLALAAGSPASRPRGPAPLRGAPAPRAFGFGDVILDGLDRLSAGGLFRTWLAVILVFGVIYWLVDTLSAGLRQGVTPIAGGWSGLGNALYFSFVTATSIGYGDVVPVHVVRALAILEGITGLLIFGVLISKLVGRRQEMLTAEIHRLTFDDRLGRVRTNLHLVFTELQGIAASCQERSYDADRFVPRIESTVAVFVGELRTVHDLLYRPQESPDEDTLEAILASLAAVLREMAELLGKLPESRRSNALRTNLRSARSLADDVCGECVPRTYAPDLKEWMDRIREYAGGLG